MPEIVCSGFSMLFSRGQKFTRNILLLVTMLFEQWFETGQHAIHIYTGGGICEISSFHRGIAELGASARPDVITVLLLNGKHLRDQRFSQWYC